MKRRGINPWVTILIIVLLLIVGGFFGYKYLFVPRIISENSFVVTSCFDTDGKNIYSKGYTRYEKSAGIGFQAYESPDFCEDYPEIGTVLRESWCEKNVYNEIRTTCGWSSSCVDGACMP